MSKKIRNRFSPPEIVAILRLHLLERTPISDLCDQHGIHPTMFYLTFRTSAFDYPRIKSRAKAGGWP
jgi:hypothetical protein